MVVSSANLATFTDSEDEIQSLVNKEYNIGDRTQHWGAPVLRTSKFEMESLYLTN